MIESDKRFIIERDIIDSMFPDCKFIIAIELNKFDDVISEGKDKLIIKCTHTCYCFDKIKRCAEYFIVNAIGYNNIICLKDCIKTLVDNNYEPSCNHIFLESFDLNTECQLETYFGS